MRELQEKTRYSQSGALLHLQQKRRGKDVPPLEEGNDQEGRKVKRIPLKRSRKPLKRTALKRKTPLKAKSPRRKSAPGESAYLKWIRTLPCIVCGGVRGKAEAAHTEVLGPAGTGRKTSHRSCIPLCCWDHTLRFDSYHEIRPESEWAQLHSLNLQSLVETYNRLFDMRRRKKAA